MAGGHNRECRFCGDIILHSDKTACDNCKAEKKRLGIAHQGEDTVLFVPQHVISRLRDLVPAHASPVYMSRIIDLAGRD